MPSPSFLRARQLSLLFDFGDGLMAGVDEVGRGPLAGPVVAAAVILDERRKIRHAQCIGCEASIFFEMARFQRIG